MFRYRQWFLMVAAAAPLALISQIAVGDDLEDARRVCTVVDSMGSSIRCTVNESAHAVDLTADTTQVDATELCTAFSGMVVAVTTNLPDIWKMRVFSDQGSGTPAAVCDLR